MDRYFKNTGQAWRDITAPDSFDNKKNFTGYSSSELGSTRQRWGQYDTEKAAEQALRNVLGATSENVTKHRQTGRYTPLSGSLTPTALMLLKSGQESGFEIPYLEGGIKSPTGLLHHQNGKAPVQRSGMISPAVENCWTSKQGTIHSPASSGCQTPVYSRGQSAVATELATVEEGYISLVPPQDKRGSTLGEMLRMAGTSTVSRAAPSIFDARSEDAGEADQSAGGEAVMEEEACSAAGQLSGSGGGTPRASEPEQVPCEAEEPPSDAPDPERRSRQQWRGPAAALAAVSCTAAAAFGCMVLLAGRANRRAPPPAARTERRARDR